LDKPITRLANDLGDRGFDHWLLVYGNYLPAPNMRWCTRKLKIEPFEQYVGDDPVNLYVAIRADERREGYISSKENITPIYPFREAGLDKADIFQILENSGVGIPAYYEWRTRSGCYFCFFQRKSEWVGLLERHPDLYEDAAAYEKPDSGYTWQQGESLEDIRQPERIAMIRMNEIKRASQAAQRRRPKSLAEAFGAVEMDEGDETGCLICHL
jgi:3'-phosphoadenosine 5'-phosphosulfate sulfotransferase (PAPS reductase)/FAD synthetase